MNVPVWQLIVALVSGVTLGVFYFGGLWYTVTRSMKSPRPHLWSLASFVVRIVVFALVMVVFARIDPILAIACFITFVVTRLFILSSMKIGPPVKPKPDDVEKEA